MTHTIHGAGIFTYIYHLPKIVGKYASPMDPMGDHPTFLFRDNMSKSFLVLTPSNESLSLKPNPRAWNDQHDSPKSDEGSKDGEPGHQQKVAPFPKNLLYKRDKLN